MANETPKVYGAIAAVSAAMAHDGISKTRKNEQQGYRFRGIDEVMNALASVLVEHRLLILPRMLARIATQYPAKSGGTIFNVAVEAEFDFVAVDDGSVHVVKMFGEAMDSADKATNKAMSAAYKYAAFQAFCIPTEGDNDADAHTPEIGQRKNSRQIEKRPSASEPPPFDPDGPDADHEPVDEPKITPQQRADLGRVAKKHNRATAEVAAWLKKRYKVATSAGLFQSQFQEVRSALEARGALPMSGDGE